MPEYVTNAIQSVPAGDNVKFVSTPVPCKKGYVLHREGSGVFTLKGITNNCAQYAQYKITFGANVGYPAGAAITPIALSIRLNGEELDATTGIATPTATENYYNVNCFTFINVPRGCCATISVANEGVNAVNVQDANIIIERTA